MQQAASPADSDATASRHRPDAERSAAIGALHRDGGNGAQRPVQPPHTIGQTPQRTPVAGSSARLSDAAGALEALQAQRPSFDLEAKRRDSHPADPHGWLKRPTPNAERGVRNSEVDGAGAKTSGASPTSGTRGSTGGGDAPSTTLRRLAKAHPAGLQAPVTALPGVSTVTSAKLAKLGLHTVNDVLWHLPHRYDDFSKIRPVSELVLGETQTVVGVVWSAGETANGRFKRSTEAVIGDHTGNVRAHWFNQPWVAKQLPVNAKVALSGKVTAWQGVRQMDSPEFELLEGELGDAVTAGRLVPVHPLTAGLARKTMRRLVRAALDSYLPAVPDPMPEHSRRRLDLLPYRSALEQVHFPDSEEMIARARHRLGFDEVLAIQLAALKRRVDHEQGGVAPELSLSYSSRTAFTDSLPFPLTGAQQKVIDAILGDLRRSTPMARLVQGDVGSGKTVVAAVAMLAAVSRGHQAALMAPTEILAEQHWRTVVRLFGGDPLEAAGPVAVCFPRFLDRPVRIALLRGSLGAKAKREAQRAISAGEVDIAIGTQALIQQDVVLPRLGLAVVDEQHRFGVAQRSALRGDNNAAHLLVMTATPIPRTLALTLYGDLEVSVIDEMPPGRKPVKTLVVESHERDDAYSFIIEQLREGRQAFVICPLVEESDKQGMTEVKAATAEFERLKEVFTSASLALLHGKMRPAEKDAVMREFRDQIHDVLVSTSVVEVGIDVPNATVVMIEGADRFGLAQLHQFRGRVGRGAYQSYCFLMADGVSDQARERLQLMEDINDGFKLAEEDLRLRGPGEYFGARQSGIPELRVANLADTALVERAREEAKRVLGETPDLAESDYAGYGPQVERLLRGTGGDVS